MANITSVFNGAAGSAQTKVGTTIKTLAISLAAGAILFAVQFITFLIFRKNPIFKRIYQPRAFLVPLRNRVLPPPINPLKWLKTVVITTSEEVRQKAGMDGYFFLRYLIMCLKIFVPAAIIIMPILIPLNVSGGKGTSTINNVKYNITGLDTLAWSNVAPDHTDKYWAHLVLAIVLIAWVCFLFHRELVHFIFKRQEFLSSPSHYLRASAKTILITDIPENLCTVEKLVEYYDDFPGGLHRIWINRNFKPLVEKITHRNKLQNVLEISETSLIREAIISARKMQKIEKKQNTGDTLHFDERIDTSMLRSTKSAELILPPRDTNIDPSNLGTYESDLQYDVKSTAAWTDFVRPNKRAKMRIPTQNAALFKIPLIRRLFSAKVDTIYYCRRQLVFLNKAIETEAATLETCPRINSAFLQFNTQKAAHLACQGLSHSVPNVMTRRTVEISPTDINWPNLGVSWLQRYFRYAGFIALFLALIFSFALISFFTGILSKASTLSGSVSWLQWIGTLPSWLLSFIQGILPPAILIIVLSGPLPIFLRALTNGIQGATTGTEGEMSLQLWYFIFLLFELFIVPTISSGLTGVVNELIHSPTSVPNLLATYLPTAANYYFSFLVVQAFSISASSILQTIRLFNYYVLGRYKSPLSVFNKLTWTNRTRIGSNIPWYTTFAVIGLVYSVVAPLILIFMIFTFSLFWVVIKNNLLYVIRTGNVDGGGLFFPSAINQLFTGLYFMEVCLVGLFFLVRDSKDKVACQAQGTIMVVAIICTAIYQWWLSRRFSGLYKYLPVTFERKAETEPLDGQRNDDYTTSSNKEESMDKKREDISFDSEDSNRKIFDESLNPHIKMSESATASDLLGASSAYSRSKILQEQQQRDMLSARRILTRFHQPVDETAMGDHIKSVVGNLLSQKQEDVEAQLKDDPVSQVIMQQNVELETLDAKERDILISIAFTHPALRETRPVVWIPQDEIGVSDDEVRRTLDLSRDVAIENKDAYFGKGLKVKVNGPPPGISDFMHVMAEL